MTIPSLYDVFFNNDFSDDTIPELEAAANEAREKFEQVVSKYNMPFSEADEVRCANANEGVMSQYLGFIQGFKWAVYLFTGHRSDEEASCNEQATA